MKREHPTPDVPHGQRMNVVENVFSIPDAQTTLLHVMCQACNLVGAELKSTSSESTTTFKTKESFVRVVNPNVGIPFQTILADSNGTLKDAAHSESAPPPTDNSNR